MQALHDAHIKEMTKLSYELERAKTATELAQMRYRQGWVHCRRSVTSTCAQHMQSVPRQSSPPTRCGCFGTSVTSPFVPLQLVLVHPAFLCCQAAEQEVATAHCLRCRMKQLGMEPPPLPPDEEMVPKPASPAGELQPPPPRKQRW